MLRFVWIGLVVACGDNTLDKTAVCRLSTTTSASTVEDRYVIGQGAPYTPDLGIAARDAELEGSIAARRQVAWQIVERVVTPIGFAEPQLAAQTLPRWHTWYARDDFERVFKTLYRNLGPAGRAMRAPLDAPAGFLANALALENDPAWSDQRYADYLAAIDTAEKANGVGGAERVGYSPGAMGHLVESYAKQYACRNAPEPERFESDPMREPRAVTEQMGAEVAGCEFRVLGPFQAGRGDVRVTTRGDGDIDLYVLRGAAPTVEAFDCRSDGNASDEECVISGDGPIYVGLFGAAPGRADVEVAYTTEDVRDPTCLDGEMPRDAVVIKADWRRQFTGETIPIYDTSAARMTDRLSGEARWNPDGAADPQPDDIYTVQIANGQRFRMPGLHIMSKELDHWVWITLWYSPTPDTDFGCGSAGATAAMEQLQDVRRDDVRRRRSRSARWSRRHAR